MELVPPGEIRSLYEIVRIAQTPVLYDASGANRNGKLMRNGNRGAELAGIYSFKKLRQAN
jgi:hypothetical protein